MSEKERQNLQWHNFKYAIYKSNKKFSDITVICFEGEMPEHVQDKFRKRGCKVEKKYGYGPPQKTQTNAEAYTQAYAKTCVGAHAGAHASYSSYVYYQVDFTNSNFAKQNKS